LSHEPKCERESGTSALPAKPDMRPDADNVCLVSELKWDHQCDAVKPRGGSRLHYRLRAQPLGSGHVRPFGAGAVNSAETSALSRPRPQFWRVPSPR
jgi:hypothetical protein